jgi:hypothetical protein
MYVRITLWGLNAQIGVERVGGLELYGNKHHAVSWALRLQRVVLQGSFASWALLYFRIKLSTLGLLLQGSGAN